MLSINTKRIAASALLFLSMSIPFRALAFPAEVTVFSPTAFLPFQTALTSLGTAIVTSVNSGSAAIMGSTSPQYGVPVGLNAVKAAIDASAAKASKERLESTQVMIDQIANSSASTSHENSVVNGAYDGAAGICAHTAAAAAGVVGDKAVAYTAQRYTRGAAVRASTAGSFKEQLNDVQQSHRDQYCDPETDPKRCVNSALSPAKPSLKVKTSDGDVSLANADVDAKTLFNGSGGGSKQSNRANLTFTQANMDAAGALNENIISSGDNPRALSGAEFDTPDGKTYEGLRLAYLARRSVAETILAEILAERAPIEGSKEILTALEKNTPKELRPYITGRINYIKSFNEFATNPKISPLELMDIQVKSRIDNPDWLSFVNTAPTMQLQREQVIMQALALRMQYMDIRRKEELAVLASITASESLKANMLPRLQAVLASLAKH